MKFQKIPGKTHPIILFDVTKRGSSLDDGLFNFKLILNVLIIQFFWSFGAPQKIIPKNGLSKGSDSKGICSFDSIFWL